jgi:hypothetical protein
MTQQEFNRSVELDIQRLVAKAQAEYEAQEKRKTAPFKYDAPYNPEFLGAQRARIGEDY